MALKFNPAHRFTISWKKKVDKKFSQSKHKKIPDTKKIKKIHKKNTKKKDKKRTARRQNIHKWSLQNESHCGYFGMFNPAH